MTTKPSEPSAQIMAKKVNFPVTGAVSPASMSRKGNREEEDDRAGGDAMDKAFVGVLGHRCEWRKQE